MRKNPKKKSYYTECAFSMKIKLTPELAYIIGLWRKIRTKEGLGVSDGRHDILEIFSKEVIEKGLTTPDKLLSEEGKVYFYHTAYRKFFQEVEKEQLGRFKYINEYAANYLAGMFDAVGVIDEERGILSLNSCNKEDEMLLLRLGFVTRRNSGRLIIEKPRLFLAFIKNYVKYYNGHKIFTFIKS